SEIESAILSGCPSVTDSEVNRRLIVCSLCGDKPRSVFGRWQQATKPRVLRGNPSGGGQEAGSGVVESANGSTNENAGSASASAAAAASASGSMSVYSSRPSLISRRAMDSGFSWGAAETSGPT